MEQATSAARDEELLDTTQMAEEYRLSEGTWRNWRYQGRGPRYFRVGKRILYRRGDVERWLEQHASAEGELA